ncbi:hypothetical protein EOT10_36685 [Streptomyces antnestii]|uniref:Lipoprotein n=1 Tax=Streptomyces antnestii TaxID=2494256 RepID=A0A3S2V8M0_9ACTN|nr:hypothetical protein [Streptomyces sp. San01]RVU16546.1 hypothetical protein EOT10_36685 [Streptomyces sp. San01]
MLATTRNTRIAGYAAVGAAVFALALSGCGGSGGGSKSSGTAKSSAPTTSSATLTAAKVDKVGTVVTDSKGFVLYRFDQDSAKPTKVTCYGSCATLWPAATATDAKSITVKGIDKKLVSTVKRSDGTTQITLAGWPLYRYSKDDQPKEAYGQGVLGTWFAATPTGAKAMSTNGGSSGSGSGY